MNLRAIFSRRRPPELVVPSAGDLFARVPIRHRAAVEEALSLVPPSARILEPRFLVGVSPVYVGLHNYREVAGYDGLTYDVCAHACFSFHTPDGVPTIVFPDPDLYPDPVSTLLHEYGHLWDEATGFSVDAPETTPYSRTNRLERIAEAFEALCKPLDGELPEGYLEAESFRPMRAAMGLGT